MWDERYSTDEYIYGTQPNDFLAARFSEIPQGKVLSLAEGEGRNAVFLARQGYAVTAVDASEIGLRKAARLATQQQVPLQCIAADLTEYDLGIERWDGIVSIFCPLPSAVRREVHAKVVRALKPGGVFLLEAYTPKQLEYGTGGGDNADTMQTAESLRTELAGLSFTHLEEIEREVVEGTYHTGLASVVQAIGRKEK
ncbi:class I SAM-dependent methyltransferase [Aeoliella sp. ICT_H6.2]|uniref:Class I SAM-dependent methyltransferase n=1 Tax=Aeoliella straminimaris TaxID=2954799 RepID=A0A9X2JFB5_9BACT|nr:class I SAM-dependent methyltransferase [Aeoliella straminimaris]MCO6043870.1 class I SAM-dependent methyltransferase [Aeoliella straminimaris]